MPELVPETAACETARENPARENPARENPARDGPPSSARPTPAPRASTGALVLRRDNFTRTLYLVVGMYGWFLYSFGPSVPLLRVEEHTSHAVAGLHGTALACGSLLAGTIGLRLTTRFGGRTLLISGVCAVGGGVTLLLIGHSVVTSLLAALVVGTGGVLASNKSMVALTHHHGASGPAAVAEATAMTSGAGILAPGAVGLLAVAGIAWRLTYLVVVALTIVSVLAITRIRWPESAGRAVRSTAPRPTRTPLPRVFWLYWCVMLSGVAGEFCTTFWASDLLTTHLSINRGAATACISVLIAAMFLGRLGAGRLVLRWSPTRVLLVGFPLSLCGWLLTWSADSVAVAGAGLFLLGLGLAPVYPLGTSLLVHASNDQPDRAYGLSAWGTGAATGTAPLLLGALADHIGTHSAFGIVPVILAAALIALAAGHRSQKRRRPVETAVGD